MSYSIKRFDIREDEEKLFSLWQKVLKKPYRKRLHALYNDSSHGASSWIIYCDNKADPVGCLAVLPLNILNPKDTTKFGMNHDMIITKENRTLGPAVMLARSLVRAQKNWNMMFY